MGPVTPKKPLGGPGVNKGGGFFPQKPTPFFKLGLFDGSL